MKSIFKYTLGLLAIAGMGAGLWSCDDGAKPTDNMLYLVEASGLNVASSAVIPDNGTSFNLTPRIARPVDYDMDVEIYVNEEKLAEYNARHGTSYQLRDPARYAMAAINTVIPAGKVAAEPVMISMDALTGDENKTGYTFGLPVSIRTTADIPVQESSSTFYYAAIPVPMADVPVIQRYGMLQLLLAEDYELSEWTFETLFNGSVFPAVNCWVASAFGKTQRNGVADAIQSGFMLRLGDARNDPPANCLNGRIQFMQRGVGSIGLRANVWHHIAITSKDRVVTVYVDGVQDYSLEAPEDYPSVKFYADRGIRLGGENRTGNNLTTAARYRYSQVRLWSVARTPEQMIANLYAVPEDSEGLVGYWKLNEYTEGKTTVNVSDTDTTVDGSAETMEIDTYFFPDATGKNPDAIVDRNPDRVGNLIFETNKRIEIGYYYDGTPAN